MDKIILGIVIGLITWSSSSNKRVQRDQNPKEQRVHSELAEDISWNFKTIIWIVYGIIIIILIIAAAVVGNKFWCLMAVCGSLIFPAIFLLWNFNKMKKESVSMQIVMSEDKIEQESETVPIVVPEQKMEKQASSVKPDNKIEINNVTGVTKVELIVPERMHDVNQRFYAPVHFRDVGSGGGERYVNQAGRRERF